MTRYLICSAQRTGSNLLCDLLAQTGQAGIRDVKDGHFFLGTGEGLKVKTRTSVDRWFANHATTPNGVQGCKGSFEYYDELHEFCGYDLVEYLLNGFTHFIYPTRQDTTAQAISWALAAQTKHFSSLAEHPAQPAEYNYHLISYFAGRIEAQYMRFETFFESYGIEPLSLSFEEWITDFPGTLQTIGDYLGVSITRLDVQPILERQKDTRKAQWHNRYLDEYQSKRELVGIDERV